MGFRVYLGMWSGKVPVQPLRICYDKARSALFLCKTHSMDSNFTHPPYTMAYRRGVDSNCHEPEQVLQRIHNTIFGSAAGHFRERDPVAVFTSAGSLFAIKTGLCVEDCGAVAVDKNVLQLEAFQRRRDGVNVFQDWPLEYMMQPGYSLWSIPREVEEASAFFWRVRGAYEGPGKFRWNGYDEVEGLHLYDEVVEFDRAKYVWLAMQRKKVCEAEAEELADQVAPFTVAVEVDLSWFDSPNLLLFMPPEDSKDPDKVMEELRKLRPEELQDLELSQVRLLPHHRLFTSWFKVLPLDQQACWEGDDYSPYLPNNNTSDDDDED